MRRGRLLSEREKGAKIVLPPGAFAPVMFYSRSTRVSVSGTLSFEQAFGSRLECARLFRQPGPR